MSILFDIAPKVNFFFATRSKKKQKTPQLHSRAVSKRKAEYEKPTFPKGLRGRFLVWLVDERKVVYVGALQYEAMFVAEIASSYLLAMTRLSVTAKHEAVYEILKYPKSQHEIVAREGDFFDGEKKVIYCV